jgi:hypothetical protein
MFLRILFLTLLLSGTSSHAASLRWRVFSPPDRSCTVQVPIALRPVKDMVGDHEPDGYKSIDVYGGRLKSKAFLLVVLVPSETMRKENPTNELGGLQWFIGGDDTTELRNEKEIIVHGLRGKQFTLLARKALLLTGRIASLFSRLLVSAKTTAVSV